MPPREGNLEPPRRDPPPWRDPEFYDAAALEREMLRVFEICHGCRRCFNLCNAFPTLFDAIDAAANELAGIAPGALGARVAGECYLCDLCFMTKCPYVPPHPFALDFPHLMLRAKAQRFRRGETRLRDRLLANPARIGKIAAAIPGLAHALNAANRSPALRAMLEAALGVHRARLLPPFSRTTLRRGLAPCADFTPRDGARSPGKVAVFATCYVNHNAPEVGRDLFAILAHNEIPARLVDEEVCCGMPRLELGDLEGVEKLKEKNIPPLARLARAGFAILVPIPSCALLFKQELPLLFPRDDDVAAVRDAVFDPFEYLHLRHRDGLLKTDFRHPLGKVAYHVPCHLRVQNLGQKTRAVLALVPGTTLACTERCSGHDGTWGVKVEHFAQSMKIGAPVFQQMAAAGADHLASDCPIAARHVCQGIGANAPPARHPLTLLRMAYGIRA